MFDLMPFERRSNNLFNLFDRMTNDSFFDDFSGDMVPCRTDILDQGDKYVLRADLPGFKKEELHLDIEGGRLTLSAEHKENVNDEKKDYVRRERRYGAMSRSFDLDGIDASRISASYHDGVLELSLPKLAEAKPESHQIQIQ